jgi:sugar phosphate isomerase/epimerase
MQLGFSTGAIAFGDFRLALQRLRPFHLEAVELSALRMHEFGPLIDALGTLDLSDYCYVAFHVPSRFTVDEERVIVDGLRRLSNRCDAVVVHPDAVHDAALWRPLGARLCFENMDKRKPIGRTARELASLFDKLPEAKLCLDLGHVWQIDRTMAEARQILRAFGRRVRQIHVSEVNTASQHASLTLTTVIAFHRVLDLLPEVPWILEAVTPPEKIANEIDYVRESFADVTQIIND